MDIGLMKYGNCDGPDEGWRGEKLVWSGVRERL